MHKQVVQQRQPSGVRVMQIATIEVNVLMQTTNVSAIRLMMDLPVQHALQVITHILPAIHVPCATQTKGSVIPWQTNVPALIQTDSPGPSVTNANNTTMVLTVHVHL